MYCTITDITDDITEATVAQLTDDNDGVTMNEDLVTRAITDSTDEIDTYLRGRYPLPLESTPREIKRICIDMTSYYLHRRRNSDVGEGIRAMYDDCVRKLKSLQSGATKLDVGTPGTTATLIVKSSSRCRVFTPEYLGRNS